jgi:hypothetical protein
MLDRLLLKAGYINIKCLRISRGRRYARWSDCPALGTRTPSLFVSTKSRGTTQLAAKHQTDPSCQSETAVQTGEAYFGDQGPEHRYLDVRDTGVRLSCRELWEDWLLFLQMLRDNEPPAGILQWKLMPAKKVAVWETMARLSDDQRAALGSLRKSAPVQPCCVLVDWS